MQVLKNIAYVLIACLALAAIFSGGLVIAAVLAVGGFIVFCISLIHMAAYVIKSYWESRS